MKLSHCSWTFSSSCLTYLMFIFSSEVLYSPILDASPHSSWNSFRLPAPCPINPNRISWACYTSFHLFYTSTLFCLFCTQLPNRSGLSEVEKLIPYDAFFWYWINKWWLAALSAYPLPLCKNNFPLKALWFFSEMQKKKIHRWSI